MMAALGKALVGIFLLFSVTACSSTLDPDVKLAEMSRDDFMSSMRWKSYKVAASLMLPEYRQDFLETFDRLKDIHIIDVRMINFKPEDENRRFEATLEMDYYLLPSVTVKTFRFDQTWELFGDENQSQQGYFIVTPFPPFP